MSEGRLFISHASEDAAVAERIVAYLEAHGVPCWIASRDIPPRAIYADAIVEGMQGCSACVVLVSAASNASKAVKREVELASHEDKAFIPIRIDASEPAAGLAYYLRNMQWADYAAEGERALNRIVGDKPGDRTSGTPSAALSGIGPTMLALPRGKLALSTWYNKNKNYAVHFDYVFGLSKYPVTFQDWDTANSLSAGLIVPEDEGWGRGLLPVVNVSWNDALAYIAWLNAKSALTGRWNRFRLPSQTEWEYACRAGTNSDFSTGDTISPAQANYSESQPQPVGAYPPNAWGLHEMHGNIWEWCADGYKYEKDAHAEKPQDGDPVPTEGRVDRIVRGGSWRSGGSLRIRAHAWENENADTRRDDIGFRLAQTLGP